MSQRALPPESLAALDYIERETNDTIASFEKEFRVTLPPEGRERLIDFGLAHETGEAIRALRSSVDICPN